MPADKALRSEQKTMIDTLTADRVLPLLPEESLVDESWEEEIEEVLSGARPASGHWAADPDWQAASDFLVRHCREALAGRRGRFCETQHRPFKPGVAADSPLPASAHRNAARMSLSER